MTHFKNSKSIQKIKKTYRIEEKFSFKEISSMMKKL